MPCRWQIYGPMQQPLRGCMGELEVPHSKFKNKEVVTLMRDLWIPVAMKMQKIIDQLKKVSKGLTSICNWAIRLPKTLEEQDQFTRLACPQLEDQCIMQWTRTMPTI